MRALIWTSLGLIGLIVLLLLGILAGRVGGVAIRREGAEPDVLSLNLSEPLIRGVPVVVRWQVNSVEVPQARINFYWRDRWTEYLLGEAELSGGGVALQFPCEAPDAVGTLVAREAETRRVMGSRAATLVAPGPECV